MKTYDFIDAVRAVDQLAFALDQPPLYTPQLDVPTPQAIVYPGHPDWTEYSVYRVREGRRWGVVARADGFACGDAICEPDVLDPTVVDIKNLWVASDERGRGVADFLVSLVIREVQIMWPEAQLLTANAKARNDGVRKLAKRHGFVRSQPLYLNQGPYGHNGEPDVIYARRLVSTYPNR